jgi:hypothetical protein
VRTFQPAGAIPAAEPGESGFVDKLRPAWWVSTDAYGLLAIAVSWLLALIAINPIGDFPIADDWAYFSSVRELVEHGRLLYSNWAAPNLVTQIVWGSLFALPFGLSYTSLRFSTEVLALIAAGALYLTLRRFGCRPWIGLLGALVLLFNPLCFVLSASFMSDVPYTAMQSVAMLFLMGALTTGSAIQRKIGWCAAISALFCRQVGMAIPLGYGFAKLSRTRSAWRNRLLCLLPFAGFVVLQVAFQAGLRFSGLMPANYGQQVDLIVANIGHSGVLQLASGLLRFAGECLYYFGFFLLPLSLLIVAQFTHRLVQEIELSLWGWFTVIAGLLTWLGPQMPVWSNNTIEAWSLGGVDVAGVPPPAWFWPLITFLSAFGALTLIAALLVTGLMVAWQSGKPAATNALFAGMTALALLGSLALLPRGTQFDRYIIPVIPCLVIFLAMRLRADVENAQPIPRWAIGSSGVVLLVIALYSVLGTHDFLAEKRAQWTALQDLIQKDHVPRETIDADWVYNAPTAYGVYGDPKKLDGWFRSADYLVKAARRNGVVNNPLYTRVRRYPVVRWAPWAQAPGPIAVVRRKSPPAP